MLPTFPQKWSLDEIGLEKARAEERFVVERKEEGPHAYYEALTKAEHRIRRAMEVTNDLTLISGDVLRAEPTLWQVLRYFCAPPVSEEDLWTFVGHKFKTVPSEHASETALALAGGIDKRRFPWFGQDRMPTPAERDSAVLATAVLLAHESLKTDRRGQSSKKQEEAVGIALKAIGLTFDPARTPILRLDELSRGHFSRERKVAGAKCDVPVRLRDGRLLALECKVSNGPKNSWKRLHREAGGKSQRWKEDFGSQVVTGAVLAGVFDLSCLVKAQEEQNLFLFWQHDLRPLTAFVNSVR